MEKLSHYDAEGVAHMVDVSAKASYAAGGRSFCLCCVI